jgi:tetratricopeptide (TPR) repeat protein
MNRVSPEELASILRGTGVRLVFLSACGSVEAAAALRRAGIPAVVAMREAIPQGAAADFAGVFYAHLAQGRTIRQAFEAAKGVLAAEFGVRDKAEVPVLLPRRCNYPLIKRAQGEYKEKWPPRPKENLPSRHKGEVFLGREREMVGANLLLAGHHVLTITGEPGIGKTALSKEVARWQLERGRFTGAAWYVADEGFSAEELLIKIDTALGLGVERSLEALTERLKDERALILLDNYETVSLAYRSEKEELKRRAEEFIKLVSSIPEPCRVIITSRLRRAGLRGECPLPIDRLPEDVSLWLFLEHARKTGWRFDGRPETEAKLKEMCIFLSGIPLAIELTAPLLSTLRISPAKLLRRLRKEGEALNLLVDTGRADVPERLKDYRASLSLSYEALSPGAKRLFAALSLFAPSGCFADAVEAVLGEAFPRWREVEMPELEEANLVRVEGEGEWVRYWLIPLLRAYASERLPELGLDVASLRRRHAEHYLGVAWKLRGWYDTASARKAAIEQLGEGAPEEAIEAFVSFSSRMAISLTDLERDNIVRGAEWAHEAGEWKTAVGYGYAADAPLRTRGYWEDMVDLLRRAVEAAGRMGEELEAARLKGNLAYALQDQGKIREAQQLFAEIEVIFKRVGGKDLATYYHQRGMAAQDQGDYEEARDYYERSLKLKEELGDKSGIASTLHQLGVLAQDQGDYKAARGYYERSLKLTQELGDKSGIALTLHQLGVLAQDQGDYKEARGYYERSLKLKEELGDKSRIASTLHQLGVLAYLQGDYEEAKGYYEQAKEAFEKLRAKKEYATVLHQLGVLAQLQGDYEEARGYYERSLKLKEELGDKSGIAKSLGQLGVLAYLQGDYEEARGYYQRSLKLEEELGDKSGIAITLHQLGMLAQNQGDYEEAREYYERSLKLKEELGDKRGIASTLHQLGMLAQDQGDYKAARGYYERSLKLTQELGDKSGIARSTGALGLLAVLEGDAAKGFRMLEEAAMIFEEIGAGEGKVFRQLVKQLKAEMKGRGS